MSNNDIKIYNKVADSKYTMNKTSQPYLVEEEKLIDLSSDYVLYGELNGMFEMFVGWIQLRANG